MFLELRFLVECVSSHGLFTFKSPENWLISCPKCLDLFMLVVWSSPSRACQEPGTVGKSSQNLPLCWLTHPAHTQQSHWTSLVQFLVYFIFYCINEESQGPAHSQHCSCRTRLSFAAHVTLTYLTCRSEAGRHSAAEPCPNNNNPLLGATRTHINAAEHVTDKWLSSLSIKLTVLLWQLIV